MCAIRARKGQRLQLTCPFHDNPIRLQNLMSFAQQRQNSLPAGRISYVRNLHIHNFTAQPLPFARSQIVQDQHDSLGLEPHPLLCLVVE